MSSSSSTTVAAPSNRQLALPYVAPYLAYVGIATLFSSLLSMEVNYLLRIIVVGLLLVWAWRWYCPLRGPLSPAGSVLYGVAAGLVGLGLWLGLLAPFVRTTDAAPWSNSAFLLRLLSAGLLVPLFEELVMRGYVFRLALQWDQARRSSEKEPLHVALDQRSVNDVLPGHWSWMAVAVSTLAFASGHTPEEWPAAIAFGLFMALLWMRRKDLLTCITAHAVTNVALAVYVSATGRWYYW